MLDPVTLFMVGAGVLAFREMNKKDYGVLTAARDERYRIAMENCFDPQLLFDEAKLFEEHGLKAQAAMLRRRGEWRGRPQEVKQAHEEIFKKGMRSENVQAILEIAAGFEGWTATRKAAALREHVRILQENLLRKVAEDALKARAKLEEQSAQENKVEQKDKPSGGMNGNAISQNEEKPSEASGTTEE